MWLTLGSRQGDHLTPSNCRCSRSVDIGNQLQPPSDIAGSRSTSLNCLQKNVCQFEMAQRRNRRRHARLKKRIGCTGKRRSRKVRLSLQSPDCNRRDNLAVINTLGAVIMTR